MAARLEILIIAALGALLIFAFVIWPETSTPPAPGVPALQCYSGGICGP